MIRILLAALVVAASFLTVLPHGAEAANPAARITVTYAAPAAARPAGRPGSNAFVGILPSGRIVKPFGRSTVVGMQALGVALSPDGRYAIVSDDDGGPGTAVSRLEPGIGAGYGLTVVDTETMRPVFQYKAPGAAFFTGVVAVRDPAYPDRTVVLAGGGAAGCVYAFDLDAAGRLTADAHPQVAVPGPAGAGPGARAFPGSLTVSGNGRIAYVVDHFGDTVAALDIAGRSLTGSPVPVGFFPYAAAPAGDNLLVTNEGLMRYARLPAPVAAPPFASAVGSVQASSLATVPAAVDGRLGAATALPLDRAPDGTIVVGGAHPSAVVTTPDARFAFVAMTNVDRIATIALDPLPHATGGTELRLFNRAPFGTQPNALALTHDGSRLYVALAGLNAIAVIDARDPVHLHRLGLIPTGWYPTALALSDDDRALFVVNMKGFGEDRGGGETSQALTGGPWSTLQRIDLRGLALGPATRVALADTRVVRTAIHNPVVPQALHDGPSKAIRHVILILAGSDTYDAVFGDLKDAAGAPYGPGLPSLATAGEAVTPNLHALARTYALATNFYADAGEAEAAHQFATAGIATAFTEKLRLELNPSAPYFQTDENPEDYPRAGYIFNSLAAHGFTYRDYGDLVRVSGYEPGAGDPPGADPGAFGLGGVYRFDVPAPAVLGGHVDLGYPGWNTGVSNTLRAQEFVRDYDALANRGAMPAFTQVWLPGDPSHSPAAAADADRALGTIVGEVTHLPQWRSTAIFVMPDTAGGEADHVADGHTYAIVVSPYAKRHYTGRAHLSTASVLKTEEELLGLGPLSLGDLLATDMADFFTTHPVPSP